MLKYKDMLTRNDFFFLNSDLFTMKKQDIIKVYPLPYFLKHILRSITVTLSVVRVQEGGMSSRVTIFFLM